jgi:di/tricarboxylate transporter
VTLDQGLALGVIVSMMGLFVWGPFRYDVVAMLALLAALAVGIVPPDRAFTGFGDEIVILIGSALVVSAGIARSGVIERILRPVAPYLTSERRQIVVLVGLVTIMSSFVKNVGALALLMPAAMQLARRSGTAPAYLLMPLAFGSLLGGLTTLVGTSPNVIVARLRGDMLGEPFRMFDFTPVGAGLALAGVAFLAVGYRLLPAGRKGATPIDAAFAIEGYTTEARLTRDSPVIGETVAALEKLAEGEVTVTTIIREQFRRYTPSAHWILFADDVLLLQGEPAALESLVARAKLELVSQEEDPAPAADAENMGAIEAVVTADSILVNRTPAQVALRERYQMNVLAVSRSGERITSRLRSIRFRSGDVVVLQGDRTTFPDTLAELHCLPLAERDMPLGRGGHGLLPVAILAVAILLVAFGLVPVAIAFFGAAAALLVTRVLPPREAYNVIEWPILILLGALIPVSEAIRTTGASDLIAGWLAIAADALPPLGAVTLIMAAAMAVTPFLNNAATVLVMAPVGVSLAATLQLSPDPFLMAVAIGAGCDFLTPIGHQCNTLVMGPGGYRFGDYARLGTPLSLIVLVLGTLLIALFWPLQPG